MQTVKVFKLGRAQAVRIPARFKIQADEVQVFQRGDDLVLRPKPQTAADVFARALLNRLPVLAPSRLFVSSLVLAELQFGAEKSAQTAFVRRSLQVFIEGMESLPFTDSDALAYGKVRAALERKGQVIGHMDTMIAAQAVSRGLVLVTDNVREFKRVPGLRCENWLR